MDLPSPTTAEVRRDCHHHVGCPSMTEEGYLLDLSPYIKARQGIMQAGRCASSHLLQAACCMTHLLAPDKEHGKHAMRVTLRATASDICVDVLLQIGVQRASWLPTVRVVMHSRRCQGS